MAKTKKKKQGGTVSEKLTNEVKKLYDSHEGTTTELGNKLLEVKKCKPHGGLTAWIKRTLGASVSVRNRCNYCIRVVRGRVKPILPKEDVPVDTELRGLLREVNETFKLLYNYAKAGDVDKAELAGKKITAKVTELMAMAESGSKPLAKATSA
jgi:hypothetical protein